jgi:alpha-glucosidase
MFDAVRFWLDMGVDGFRLDAIGTIFEDIDLPDHPVEQSLEELMRLAYEAKTEEDQKQFSNLWESMFAYQHDQPGIHDLMRDLRSLIDEYDDRVLVGETDEISFYGSGDDELHMIFNFPLMRTDRITPIWVRENQRDRLAELPPGAWPCNTLNNHDTTRMRTAFSDGAHELDLVKLNLALMLTLKGTPFLYNGEEIGMTDYPLSEIGQFKDNLGVWTYHVAADVFGLPYEEAVKAASGRSRDKARTPCQWRNAPNGGFCPPDVQPWLPVNPNYQEGVNYEDQQGDAHSLLNYYRKLISVRRENPALIDGEFQTVDKGAEGYLAFLRTSEHQNFLVALNYSDSPQRLDLDLPASTIKVVFSSCTREGLEQTTKLNLEPFEVFIGQYVR